MLHPAGADDAFRGATLAHLLQQPIALFDKEGLWVHTIFIVGSAPHPDFLLQFQILQPIFDISQPLECAMPNSFGLGTRVGAPKWYVMPTTISLHEEVSKHEQ